MKLFSKPTPSPIALIPLIQNYLTILPFSRGYYFQYRTIAKRLEQFQKIHQYTLTTNNITAEIAGKIRIFYEDELQYSQNTIVTNFRRIRAVLNYAQRQGYLVNFSINEIKIKKEQLYHIHLTEEELYRIYALPLSPELEKTKDLFLIACFTGLRYSDLQRLSPANFNEGYIHTKMLKTKKNVTIPIHWIVQEIYKKYNNNLPPKTCMQNYNARIKAICRHAGITELIKIEYTKGGKYRSFELPKFQLVTSHTARRTMAYNMLIHDIPVFRIMNILGISTFEIFYNYTGLASIENARAIENDDFFKKRPQIPVITKSVSTALVSLPITTN